VTRQTNHAWAELAAWATDAAGLSLSALQLDQLRAYVDLLQRWNAKIALVSQRDLDEILSKHVADSLFAAAHCGAARRIADLGSGGGFPAVPTAVLHPSVEVCCFEATAKKVSFLEATRAALRLTNISVREGRIEAAAADTGQRAKYDLVTSRALADLDRLSALARPLLSSGGRLMAMRAAGAMVPTGGDVISYLLPDGTPRELVILAEH
jgi:16S rRNA (guanine527-N7)-methyltransferase